MAPAALKIVVPGQPRGKGRPRFNTKTGRAYTPEQTARYETFVKLLAREAMEGRRIIVSPVVLRIDMYMPIPASWSIKKRQEALYGLLRPETKPDADNAIKAVMDALNEVVYDDDKRVVDFSGGKYYALEPRVEITIRQLF